MKTVKKTTMWWIVGLLIFFGIAAVVYSSFTLRMIGHWAMILFGMFSVGVIIHSFSGVFCKKACYRWLLTAVIMVMSVGGYMWYKEGPKVVRMKEDVLYILPKSQTPSNDEIFDGSKNDPNLKQDTVR